MGGRSSRLVVVSAEQTNVAGSVFLGLCHMARRGDLTDLRGVRLLHVFLIATSSQHFL